MLHFFAGVLAFFGSLFGPVQPTPTPLPPAVPAPSTTTVINKTVYQYLPATTTPTATTKTVYQYLPGTSSPAITVSPAAVSEAELTQKLAALQSTLEARTTQAINHYSDTSSPRTSGLTLNNLTVSGVTGLTSADIPDLSARYLSTAGGTISGNLTITGSFNGAALSLANASTTLLSVLGPAYFGTTATSTFGTDGSLTLAGTLTANGNTTLTNATTTSLFVKQALTASSAAFGATATSSFSTAGALTLASALTVPNGGTGTTTWQTGSIPFFNGSNFTENNSNLYWDNTNNRLGIGTTTPEDNLSIAGDGTSASTLELVNTNTAGWTELDFGNTTITHGAAYVFLNGASQGGAGGPNSFNIGTAGLYPISFEINNSATPQVTIASNGNVGIGTTTPAAALHVDGTSIFGSNSLPTNSLSAFSHNLALIYDDKGHGFASLLVGSKEVGNYAGGGIEYGYGNTSNAWTPLYMALAEVNDTSDLSTRDYAMGLMSLLPVRSTCCS